jgi:hypothetical protein
MSYEEFQNKVKTQNNKCAICGLNMEPPNVDHCHQTEKTRDLLCTPCNHLLGNAKESIEILETAIQYLRRHHEQ